MLFTWLLNFLSGGILNKIVDYLTASSDDDAKVAVAEVQAEIATRQAQKEVIAIEQGWWVTAWIRPSIIYPFSLHLGGITLESIFHFGWKISALPAPIDSIEQAVVLSFFITRPFEKIGRNAMDYLRK